MKVFETASLFFHKNAPVTDWKPRLQSELVIGSRFRKQLVRVRDVVQGFERGG